MRIPSVILVAATVIIGSFSTVNSYPWTPISITPIYKPVGSIMVQWGEMHELTQTEFDLYKSGGGGGGITETFWQSGSGETYNCGCDGDPYDCLETIVIYPSN